MTHDGFTNAFRFIDYTRRWKWQPPSGYNLQFIGSEQLERRELLHGISFEVFILSNIKKKKKKNLS